MTNRKYFEVLGRLQDFTPDEYDARREWIEIYLSIQRLAKKHHRLAEMDCNGVGYVRGEVYYSGAIDDWVRKEYGSNVKDAYIIASEDPQDEEITIFSYESEKVENKILDLAKKINLRVEFQGDPRGATVQLYQGEKYIPMVD